MAIIVHGVENDLDHPFWEQVQEAQSLLNGLPAGIVSGFKVSASAGTRLVSVASGRAAAPGVEIISDAAVIPAALDAGTAGMGRRDLVVLEVDWSKSKTLAGTVKVLKGQPAADSPVAKTPTRTAGVLYQIPLAEVEVASSTGSLATGNLDDVRPLADTGWIATTPSGNWSLPSTQGLAVRRRGEGATRLGGRLLREAGAPTVAAGTETTVGALRLIPSRFLPSREVNTYAVWDVGNAPGGQAWVRIDPAGFVYITPLNKGLTANSTVRFLDTTWEV